MNTNSLSTLIDKWKSHLIVKGAELLLPVQMAIPFAEDLVNLGEIIMGYDGWRYVDEAKKWIVQVLEAELTLEEYISWGNMTPERNFEILRTFLMKVPSEIDFISFRLNDPELENKLMQEASRWCQDQI